MYEIKQIDDFTIGIQKPSSPSTYANMDKSIYAPHFNEIYCTLKIIRARTRRLTENRIPWSCNPTEIYLKNRIKVIENSWNITQEDSYIERHISTVTIQKYNNMHACVCSIFEKYSIFKMLKVDLSWIIAEMSYDQRVYARVVFPLSFIVNLCGFFIGSLRHVHI